MRILPIRRHQRDTASPNDYTAGKKRPRHAVKGNFDDAQSGVKAIFTDKAYTDELKEMGIRLSSANSINWGRLVPQVAYYFSVYCDMANAGAVKFGDEINIAVPTGNFGNILAAYIAKLCGLPVKRFICASNKNNVLTDFIQSGTYDKNRPFYLTTSPINGYTYILPTSKGCCICSPAGTTPRCAAIWRHWLRTESTQSARDCIGQ